MNVAPLCASDNEALLALSRVRTTGRLEFRVERGPDFFALPRRFGDTRVYGATTGGELLASVSVSRQRRFVGGASIEVPYVHDLRASPLAAVGCAAALLRHVWRVEGRDPGWAFATVLSGNPLEDALVRAAARLFGGATLVGRTSHVAHALPWAEARGGDVSVEEVSEERGAAEYVSMAADKSFAPADARAWHGLSGRWLLARRGETVLAVTMGARETDRTIVRTFDERPFQVGYLAFFCARERRDEEAAEAAFLGHLSSASWANWSFVCRGYAGDAWPARGQCLLVSTTYSFGSTPASLTLGLPELTLV